MAWVILSIISSSGLGAIISSKINLLAGLVIVAAAILLGVFCISNDSAEDPGSNQADQEQVNQPDNQPAAFLQNSFPDTDFTNNSVNFSEIISGGPAKDGIPALTNPEFEDLSVSNINEQVRTIVFEAGNETRIYPYSILNHHEIVNDQIDGQNITVTFCPLCGSAIVFDPNTEDGLLEFGVSGALRESNMIMYDRTAETLWQQSTGQALAGELNGSSLDILPFQLLTIAEAKQAFPGAKIMSTDTGYARDYDRNPYSGYEDSDGFITGFEPSITDTRYPAKEIFIAFNFENISYAVPLNNFRQAGSSIISLDEGSSIVLKTDGSLIDISSSDGQKIPHYFEMWFSWAVQHQDSDTAVVFDPAN